MSRSFFVPVSLFVSLCCLPVLSGPVRAQSASSSVVNSQTDPVYAALSTSDVYVAPGVSGIDAQVLQQAATQSEDKPHTRVKIAVLTALPPEYLANLRRAMARNSQLASQVGGHVRAFYTFQLHKALGLDRTPLVLVVLHGVNPGVTVWTTALTPSARLHLEEQYGPAIASDPQAGTDQLALAVASEINRKEYGSSMILWGVFLLVILVITALIVSAGRKKKAEMRVLRGPITALRENVLSGIEYLDGYMDVLPKNNPDSDQTRAFRQSASAKYEQGVKILDRATEMTDLNRAQALLDQAQADVQSARHSLDRATGGTGKIPGDDALRPPPLPVSQPQVDAIPEGQRGVSFFSGRPAPLSSLVPVTITLGGQSRQVLVTPQEADELRQGRMPQVLAFQSGGQSQPWYEYGGYDPYRDYWRYENSGWGGFGNGMVAGYVGAELLGGLLSPGYGMGGYSPYAFATDMPAYQGYADPGYADPGYASSGFDNGAGDFSGNTGGDFFTDNGNNFDPQGFDPTDQGSGDFFTDGGGGGGDFSDSGGFDGGGGDFGGGDNS